MGKGTIESFLQKNPVSSRQDFLKQSALLALSSFLPSNVSASAEIFQGGPETKFVRKEDGQCELLCLSGDPEKVHESGNEFDATIGKILKDEYPSRVEGFDVTLSEYPGGGDKPYFVLVWECKFIKCDPRDAEYYFTRRGTMLSGTGPEEAIEKVRKVDKTGEKSISPFKNGKVKSVSGCGKLFSNGVFWYIQEYFSTAGK